MLKIADLEFYTEQDIPKLLNLVRPILQKRLQLHEKYSRGANDRTLMYSSSNQTTKLPFEKFIVDLATGYTAGTPTYKVNISEDNKKSKILEEILDKKIVDKDYADKMKIIIDYITRYNDDGQENYDLFHDIFELTSCYEVIYENEYNEIVYSKFSPLNTVATWDYSIPANLTGLVRVWEEQNLNGTVTKVELTDINGIRQYSIKDRVTVMDSQEAHQWGDVPAIAVETDYALFEGCEDIIQAFEQIVQNMRNTYQYNDADCKLILTGYSPENDMTIVQTDDQGNSVTVQNPARQIEDNAWIQARTIYVGENGKVEWLSKPLDAQGCETILKNYQDLMFQLAGIPNTSDLAFNGEDLNASAIDRKFYVMNMTISNAVSQLKKAYLRRWELVFNRINLKKSTDFDFRDIIVDLPKNLPNNSDEMIESLMQLEGKISDHTLLESLGYDYDNESAKLKREASDDILQNIEMQKRMAEINDGTGETTSTDATMASNGLGAEEGTGETSRQLS